MLERGEIAYQKAPTALPEDSDLIPSIYMVVPNCLHLQFLGI